MTITSDQCHTAILRCLHAKYDLGPVHTSDDLARLFHNPRFRAATKTVRIDQYRAEQRQRRIQNEQLPKHIRPLAPLPSPLEQLLHRERVEQLRFLAMELPERERHVVQTVDLGGRTIAQLSQENGESESSLRSLRHRGLARMRRRARELGWT